MNHEMSKALAGRKKRGRVDPRLKKNILKNQELQNAMQYPGLDPRIEKGH